MTTVTEKPILFSGEMVRAIRAGRKTQTRRVGKCQKDDATELGVEYIEHATRGTLAQATYRAYPNGGTARWELCECPYGIPGNRLWVRETWRQHPEFDYKGPGGCLFKADGGHDHDGPFKPSIHMPRWASRLTLEMTALRVERVQDITEEDAEAEGIQFLREHPDADETLSARKLYEVLWDHINAKRGFGWDVNPWVWVVEFPRIEL